MEAYSCLNHYMLLVTTQRTVGSIKVLQTNILGDTFGWHAMDICWHTIWWYKDDRLWRQRGGIYPGRHSAGAAFQLHS